MARPLLPAALAALGFLGAGSFACIGKDPYAPGTGIGIFHVTAALDTSSCGDAPNPWEFDIRLRHDHNILYWVQGGEPVGGVLDANATTDLTSTDTEQLRAADAQHHVPACVMSRTDAVHVALAGGGTTTLASDPSPATAFAGTLEYSFAADPSSDCSDQGYAALPCTVKYTLAAKRTGDAP